MNGLSGENKKPLYMNFPSKIHLENDFVFMILQVKFAV